MVIFDQGLSDEFHKTITEDKDQVDLLIVIGSSLKVNISPISPLYNIHCTGYEIRVLHSLNLQRLLSQIHIKNIFEGNP